VCLIAINKPVDSDIKFDENMRRYAATFVIIGV
jgi:hypothetical protein